MALNIWAAIKRKLLLLTVLSVVVAAYDGQFIGCTANSKRVRVTNSLSIWLRNTERSEIQSTKKKEFIELILV